jgi:hypothetical protein
LKTNVIAPNAEAGLHIRLATTKNRFLEILEKTVDGRGEIEVMSVAKPVKMLAVEGFRQKVVRFTTDIPHLSNWGTPLLARRGLDSRRAYERRIRVETRFGRSGRALCEFGEKTFKR